jgi:stage II sporulation protein D
MTSVTLTQSSQSSAQRPQRISFVLLCEYLCALCVSIHPLRNRRYRYIIAVLACVVAVYWYSPPNTFSLLVPAANTSIVNESEIDEALQQAAIDALGQREGTIIVMDPQTGRVRAIVNPQIATEDSFAPGSTIKTFTALAALRSGLIDKDSHRLCRSEYSHEGFQIACAHPKDLPPFDPAEAIAHSCNYYFGTLGERLSERSLSETLASFGFGKQTGINTDRESAGKLLRGKRDPRNALGEGNYLQATPIQLITAYSTLVNGGRLFTPRVASAKDFHPQSRADLLIAAEHRTVIVEGMRGAVVYGTAKNAGLDSLPLNIIGKTGTSAPNRGFRSQGWFVGFASDPAAVNVSPESVELAVLVFLYKGHGAEAAGVSRSIFEEYARARQGDGGTAKRGDTATRGDGERGRGGETAAEPRGVVRSNRPVTPSPRLPVSPSAVRVHLVRENVTREMSFEDYVLGVVAAEGSTEDQPEALKALAIAARTYALKNLGRHRSEGYDFCTLTHCQRFMDPAGAQPRASVVAAVRETTGLFLRDQKGQLVDSYFSASCGGVTANMQTLWWVSAPAYLRGVRDEYCATMPHHSWTDVIPSAQLLKALRSDARTDPGATVNDVVVTQRDATGRAQSITINGERRRTVSGWDFKIIIGRALGWNLLKSSRFEIARDGANFIFRGSGFGHGLGLCQEGAHVMARRGADYSRILAKYFPTTSVASKETRRRGDGETGSKIINESWRADLLVPGFGRDFSIASSPRLAVGRATLSSEHFRVSYPMRVQPHDAEHILQTLESSRADLLRRTSAASISVINFPSLEIFINDTTGDFVGRTGQPWWAAAATKGHRIELQPIAVLKRRGVLETTLRHEMVHPLIDEISHGRAPRWLAEGLAIYLAGEGPMISRYAPQSRMRVEEIEQNLARPSSVQSMRAAYAAAYSEITELIKKDGEASLWRRVASS